MSKEIVKNGLESQRGSNQSLVVSGLESAVQIFTENNYNKLDAKAEMFYFRSIIEGDDRLAAAAPEELVQIYLSAARLGLTFQSDYQFIHVLPYWSSKKNRHVPSFQIGYKGMEYLLKKSGVISKVIARDLVYEGEDYFTEIKDGKLSITHKKAPFGRKTDKPELGGYIWVQNYKGDDVVVELSHDDFNFARSRSKSWPADVQKQKESVWHTNRSKMCLKTLWRRLYSELLADMKIAFEQHQSPYISALQEAAKIDAEDIVNPNTETKQPTTIQVLQQTPEVEQEVENVVAEERSNTAHAYSEEDQEMRHLDDENLGKYKVAIVSEFKTGLQLTLSAIKGALGLSQNATFSRKDVFILSKLYGAYRRKEVEPTTALAYLKKTKEQYA